MEAEFKNKIRTFEAVFDRKIRTSRLDFRKCSYKINGVYLRTTTCYLQANVEKFNQIHLKLEQI